MRRVATLVSTATVMMFTVGLLAQAKTNFAGKWIREAPAAPAAGAAGGGGFGAENTITQDATTLTVEYTQGQNPVKLVFKLDGSESKNAGRGGEVVSTAKWDGSKLVITTKTENGDQVQTWSMEGGNLTIERTGGRGAGKTTYKKST